MSDEFTPTERRMLDVWTAMEPPAHFIDHVMAGQPQRRWLPYAIAALGCAAAAATLILVLRPTAPAEPEPLLIALTPPDARAAVAPIVDAGVYIVDGAVFPRAPIDPYDVDIEVGQTATIHDPAGKTRINFFTEKCRAGMQVEIDLDSTFRRRTANQGVFGVVMPFAVGSWSYRAFCMSGGMPESTPIGLGRITVVRDDGRRALTQSVPPTQIQADGGVHLVPHPGLPPSVQVVRPPGGELLHLTSPSGKTQELALRNVRGAVVQLDDLVDGTHTLRFSRGGITMGKVTTFEVAFDPASAQIQLDLPRDGDPVAQTFEVRGSVRAGWGVSFEGSAIAISTLKVSPFPFSGRGVLRPGFKSIAVRFDHPQRGTHFYVRRLK